MAQNTTSTPQEEFQNWLNSQSGYVGKANKAQWWNDYETGQENQSRLDGLFKEGSPAFAVSGGSPQEQQGRIEGLERAKILTGQDPYQIGADYQEAYGNIKKRSTLSDTGSELLRANKAGAVADTRNQLQQQGVKGGAAAGAASQVERAKSYDVNNQLQQAQRQAEQDYANATKANANFTLSNEMNFGSLAAGGNFKEPKVSSNGFGTVICTELHRQGIMSAEMYQLEVEYGNKLLREDPELYWGYRIIAGPIVDWMKESKAVTHLAAAVAIPWANKTPFGRFAHFIGVPLCRIAYRILGEKYVRN